MVIKTAILKRLGPIPFWRGEKKCQEELEKIYKKAAEKAASALADTAKP